MVYLVTTICILSFFVILLLLIAVSQIKLAGMEVSDFWTFLKANDTLNKLYAFSLKYENLSPGQQLEFLDQANKIFSAFDKVPDQLWEEDYEKYMKVLDKYQDIKMLRWEAKKNVVKVPKLGNQQVAERTK